MGAGKSVKMKKQIGLRGGLVLRIGQGHIGLSLVAGAVGDSVRRLDALPMLTASEGEGLVKRMERRKREEDKNGDKRDGEPHDITRYYTIIGGI